MDKADQLIVEVYFVTLPAMEMEERRERLRVLLLRGACRFIQQQPSGKLPTMERMSARPAQG
jgi:hypothetical protein